MLDNRQQMRLINRWGGMFKGCATKANIDVGGDVISSPHDPSVRYSKKNKNTEWRGYKAQVTETVDAELAIITDIGIHSAIERWFGGFKSVWRSARRYDTRNGMASSEPICASYSVMFRQARPPPSLIPHPSRM